jgi:hypothetical protein
MRAAPQGPHVILGAAGGARRRADQVGYPAGVAGQIRALQVDQVGYRSKDQVQVGAADPARELRLGIQDGIPVRSLVQAGQSPPGDEVNAS